MSAESCIAKIIVDYAYPSNYTSSNMHTCDDRRFE
jgi:hypothetical protein